MRFAVVAFLALGACASGAADCPEGSTSAAGACRPVCSSGDQCLASEHCEGGACVPGASGGHADASSSSTDAAVTGLDATEPPLPDAGDGQRDAAPADARPSPDANVVDPRDGGQVGRDGSSSPLPDLRVSTGFNPGAPAIVGGQLPVAVDIENAGGSGASNVRVGMYLNAAGDRAFSPNSLRLGAVELLSLASGAHATRTIGGALPDSVEPGRYVLLLVADPDGVITEGDETNNVTVVGDIDVSSIEITPSSVSFGSVTACGEARQTVTINNRGARAAMIDEISFSGSSYFRPELPPGAISVPARGMVSVSIVFSPEAVGQALGTLTIEYRQAGSPAQIPVSGTGAQARITFAPPHERRVDLLFVVDDSGPVSTLVGLVPSWVQALDAAQIDYRIAVVGALDLGSGFGLLRGPSPAIITPQTPNGIQALQDKLGQGPPIVPTTNTGLAAISAVVGGNQLLRPEAWLSVVVLSSEDDNSRTADPSDVHQQIRATKGGADGIGRVHAIVPSLMECGLAGTRYNSLATLTGGFSAPVCDPLTWNFPAVVSNPRYGNPFRFGLGMVRLDPSAVSVQVGGVRLLGNQWSFDANNNELRLNGGAVPSGSDTVEVVYTPICQG